MNPLAALTVAALVVRVAFLLLEPSTQPVADETTWTRWAVEVLASPRVAFSPFRTRMIFYPPLYPYFLAVPYSLSGSLVAAKIVQAIAGALLVPAVGRVGERAFGARAGLAAAALVAFYPDLVWFSVHFWSETLFMLMLWWAFERALAADRAARLRDAVAAGLLWGLAILTRETILYFAPAVALWLAIGRNGGRARGSAFLLAAFIVVAPWTLRNWLVHDAFVPVSTAGGLNLWQGNAGIPREEVYEQYKAVHGRVEQYRYARRMGIDAISRRQPGWFLEKLVAEMPSFWEADSLALIHIRIGAYGAVSATVASVATAIVVVPYLAVLALFVFGVAVVPLGRPTTLLLGFLAYYNLLHVITHGFARYRLPVMPVLFLMAGVAWAAWREGHWMKAGYRQRAAAWATAVVLALCLLSSFSRPSAGPAFTPRDPGEPIGDDAG